MGSKGLVLRERGDSCTFTVKVVPRASKDEVAGVEEGMLRLRIQAPPVEGAANERVRTLLADLLGIPRGRVVILRGAVSRRKLVEVSGVDGKRLSAAFENQG
jgi:uncharacterized protein (TIGR00251 family)